MYNWHWSYTKCMLKDYLCSTRLFSLKIDKLLCKKLKICNLAQYKNTILMLCPFWGSWVPVQHNIVWADACVLTKYLCPLFGGRGAGSPSNSNTMLLGSRPTSLPSGILIHPGISRQHIWAENWGGVLSLFGGREPGPHLTQCCQGQVSSWSIKPFCHSTPTLQTDRHRQRSDSKINWVKCGFLSAATPAFYQFKIHTSADPYFTPGLTVKVLTLKYTHSWSGWFQRYTIRKFHFVAK